MTDCPKCKNTMASKYLLEPICLVCDPDKHPASKKRKSITTQVAEAASDYKLGLSK